MFSNIYFTTNLIKSFFFKFHSDFLFLPLVSIRDEYHTVFFVISRLPADSSTNMSVLLTICLYFNAFLASFILLSYLYMKYYIFNHWKKKGVDFIPPTFPFGNFKDVLFGKKSMGVAVADIYKVFKSKGVQHGGYFAFNQPVFTTTCPELVRNITCKDFPHFEERG